MNPLTLEWVEKAEGDPSAFRYPGHNATRDEALSAVKVAQAVRFFVRQ